MLCQNAIRSHRFLPQCRYPRPLRLRPRYMTERECCQKFCKQIRCCFHHIHTLNLYQNWFFVSVHYQYCMNKLHKVMYHHCGTALRDYRYRRIHNEQNRRLHSFPIIVYYHRYKNMKPWFCLKS